MWILGQLLQIAGLLVSIIIGIMIMWVILALILAFWKVILAIVIFAAVYYNFNRTSS